MYKLLFFIGALCLFSCQRNSECENEPVLAQNDAEELSSYDSLYAEKLGADEYGMHGYFMAFLKEGPNRNQSEEEVSKIQRAHLDNITRMANEGFLVLAGPFMDEGTVKGIYVFKVETLEEAEELTKTDPAVKSGRLIMELHPWYGSAALVELNEIHKRIAKIDI